MEGPRQSGMSWDFAPLNSITVPNVMTNGSIVATKQQNNLIRESLFCVVLLLFMDVSAKFEAVPGRASNWKKAAASPPSMTRRHRAFHPKNPKR